MMEKREADQRFEEAVADQELKGMVAALEAGADVDAELENLGVTALIWAAMRNDREMAKELLRRGADPERATGMEITALQGAASNNHPEMVRLLIESGAEVMRRTRRGESALHFAGLRGMAESCEALLSGGAEVDARNDAGETGLILAAQSGNLRCVEALLLAGADMALEARGGLSAERLAEGDDAMSRGLSALLGMERARREGRELEEGIEAAGSAKRGKRQGL